MASEINIEEVAARWFAGNHLPRNFLTKAKDKVTNKMFAATNEEFKKACAKLGVQPTARQASKARNRRRRWRYGWPAV